MANVKMSVPKVEVLNEQTGPEFEVKSNNKLLGRLYVSRGGVRWLPSGHEEDAHHVSWAAFDKLMRQQPRK
ncbi:hypothetical protein AB7714_25575 [Tardiphaga sp. 1201_B9_N1_1]|jgi:hypothetical protein|uniref:hypothetical protein n=1 Tax=unclassified Tardiphaga TaxID=2631404 RepID=UPI003F272A07